MDQISTPMVPGTWYVPSISKILPDSTLPRCALPSALPRHLNFQVELKQSEDAEDAEKAKRRR